MSHQPDREDEEEEQPSRGANGRGDAAICLPVALSVRALRCSCGCAVLNGQLYVVGGVCGPLALSEVEVYDADKNSWSAGVPMQVGGWVGGSWCLPACLPVCDLSAPSHISRPRSQVLACWLTGCCACRTVARVAAWPSWAACCMRWAASTPAETPWPRPRPSTPGPSDGPPSSPCTRPGAPSGWRRWAACCMRVAATTAWRT